jgi:hypothetical protein
MTRSRVRAEDSKEVRKSIQDSSHVHLRSSTFVKHIVQFLAISSSNFQRMEPFCSLKPVGEDDHVGGNSYLVCGSRARSVVNIRICAAWAESNRLFSYASKWKSGKFDRRVVKSWKPALVKDSALAPNSVIYKRCGNQQLFRKICK